MKFSTLLSNFFVIALMFLTIITISESAPLSDEIIEPRVCSIGCTGRQSSYARPQSGSGVSY
ncbi:12314_t:CDS:2 [Acaulospora morrowiae]|uniref:12314_t:CDS:1 n=1 Tax=Acaulospora morrowiae TaxID=94023 RepID=A0A9N8WNU5_9GLOM|nr:12314_t:CDS:2 [Acaulospora morrowiae]